MSGKLGYEWKCIDWMHSSRNVNTINLKIFPKHGGICKLEKIQQAFSWFLPGGWNTFEKEGTSEKGCIEMKDWGTSVHFVLGF